MNKNTVAYFSYEWMKYLITFVLIVLFWIWITGVIVTPKKTERLNIFINDESILELDIYNKLIELDGIKDVNVDLVSYKNEMYQTLFNSRGVVDTDMLILKSDSFLENDVAAWVVKLDLKYLEKLNISNIYYINEVAYGIYLNEDEILFLNSKSLNLGEMNKENDNNDLAIQAIIKLMEN